MFRSRIKWIALLVLILSVGSLVVHLSITKSSGVQLASYARDSLWQDFDSLLGAKDFRNKHLWRPVKALGTLQPYANPRNSYPGTTTTVSLLCLSHVFCSVLHWSLLSLKCSSVFFYQLGEFNLQQCFIFHFCSKPLRVIVDVVCCCV